MGSLVVSLIPEDTLLLESHEYALKDENRVRVGISHYAAEALGDVVFVDLPELGDTLDKGDTFGTVESVKAASDLYMPVSGEIVAVNNRLEEEPELVSDDCYGDGWIIEVELKDEGELNELMTPQRYAEYLESAEG